MKKLDLSSFNEALNSLDRALTRAASSVGDEELRDACIQRFENTFELSWKMLKRRLERDIPGAAEVDALSYRALIRTGAEVGLLDDVEAWFVYRDQRNQTSHTYDGEKAAAVYAVLPAFALHSRDLLERLELRGKADA